jgi:hypothetical protein
MNRADEHLLCAVCQRRGGREATFDGRLLCTPCATARPALMTRQAPVPLMDSYASFVGLVMENRSR